VRVDLIYRASHVEELAFKDELDQITAQSGGLIKIHYMVGSRSEHPMDAAHLLSVVPGVRESDIYVCGPKPLVWAVVDAAAALGMSHDRVHHEEFEFHNTVANT
jgi:ferredoxin-NADP reductase